MNQIQISIFGEKYSNIRSYTDVYLMCNNQADDYFKTKFVESGKSEFIVPYLCALINKSNGTNWK